MKRTGKGSGTFGRRSGRVCIAGGVSKVCKKANVTARVNSNRLK